MQSCNVGITYPPERSENNFPIDRQVLAQPGFTIKDEFLTLKGLRLIFERNRR